MDLGVVCFFGPRICIEHDLVYISLLSFHYCRLTIFITKLYVFIHHYYVLNDATEYLQQR